MGFSRDQHQECTGFYLTSHGQVTSPRRASDDVNAKSPPETFTVVKEVNKLRFHQDGKRKLLPRKRIGMRNRDTGPRPCDSRPSTRTAGVPLPVPVRRIGIET